MSCVVHFNTVMYNAYYIISKKVISTFKVPGKTNSVIIRFLYSFEGDRDEMKSLRESGKTENLSMKKATGASTNDF